MNKRFCSITSTIALLALALLTAPGCALIGLEEEEEETTTVATGSLSDIEGTWVKACGTNESFGKTVETITVVESSQMLVYEIQTFDNSDSSCGTPQFTWTLTTGNLVAGSQGTLNNGSKGYGLEGTYLYYTLTPNVSDSYLAGLSTSICGLDSWTSGQAKSLIGSTCARFSAGDPTDGWAYSLSGNDLYFNATSSTFTKQ